MDYGDELLVIEEGKEQHHMHRFRDDGEHKRSQEKYCGSSSSH